MLVSYNLQCRDWDVVFHSYSGLILGCNNFIDARGCGELWFIVTLLWLKIVMQFCKKEKIIWGGFLLSILCAITYKSLIHNSPIKYWGIGIFNVFVAYPFFAIGYFLRIYKTSLKHMITTIEDLPLSAIALLLSISTITIVLAAPTNGLVHMVYGGYGKNILLYLILGTIGIAYTFFIAAFLSKIKKWHKYVQNINIGSVMILGIHIGLVNKIRPYLVTIFGKEEWIFELSVVIASLALLLAFIPMIKLVQSYFPFALGYRK